MESEDGEPRILGLLFGVGSEERHTFITSGSSLTSSRADWRDIQSACALLLFAWGGSQSVEASASAPSRRRRPRGRFQIASNGTKPSALSPTFEKQHLLLFMEDELACLLACLLTKAWIDDLPTVRSQVSGDDGGRVWWGREDKLVNVT